MTRVLVVGGSGMLGHKLVQRFAKTFDTRAAVRGDPARLSRYGFLPPEGVVGTVDAREPRSVAAALETARPDVVVNCIGIVKQAPEAREPALSLRVNALFPHELAELCVAAGARLIHVSTDCVFRGDRGAYREDDPPDATDLYGRTKALGEVSGPGVLTIRTSMVGRELKGSRGLVEWLLSRTGSRVKGYTAARFTGLTTLALAEILTEIISNHPDLEGIWHVASDPIDKYELLGLIRAAFHVRVEIDPDSEIRIDRTLDGMRFRERTGLACGSWPEMIRGLAADPTPYETWRRTA